ncbi:MAG: hypothetical protein J6K53_14445 [Roseburia sp.]|nr:hypothetical protein [Roseburia sp.]
MGIRKNEKIRIEVDSQGNKMVVLSQILFQGKRSISWNAVEEYLRQYVGRMVEIAETGDIVYIGNDFANEFAGSVYTHSLRGGLAKAKANMAQGIPELIEIATQKRWNEDFERKHGKKAQKGWYRYNTRFALPVMGEDGITKYNKYQAVLIIRYASDDKLYLYDIQNIKKETSNPP